LEDVAEAVSVASEVETRIYVERIGNAYRWSLVHAGGMYPLLRIAARFLRVDYHRIFIGFRTVAEGVVVLSEEPDKAEDPDAWAVIEFDGATTPSDVKRRIVGVLLGDEEIRVWLDDDLVDRAAPPGWTHVVSVKGATDLLDRGRVVELSLDHDLGDDERFGRGIEVIDWLAEQQEVHGRVLWPRDGLVVHSANPAGRDAMIRAAERYAAKVVRVSHSLTPSGKPG